jgi:hypothetical protein
MASIESDLLGIGDYPIVNVSQVGFLVSFDGN